MTNAAPLTDGWEEQARKLTIRLAESGDLDLSPRLRKAFETTPRHTFVPTFYSDVLISGPHGPVRRRFAADTRDTAAEWLAAVYSDTSLIVQTTRTPDGERDLISSSSTMPSLMARMLTLLDIDTAERPDYRVLEIGTATGYNAAILCAVLGDQYITSIELHPDLAAAARQRLASLDLHPTVVAGDGADGYPPGAPYNRIIATCGTDHVPGPWVVQLADGGRIVLDLRSEAASSLAVLDKHDPARVSGHLIGHPGHFMWMRPDPHHPMHHPDAPPMVIHDDDRTTTRLIDNTPHQLDAPGLRTLIGITDPTIQISPSTTDDYDDTTRRFILAEDGSWCDLTTTPAGATARQGGPRQIWDHIETTIALWSGLGSPPTERYGVTIDTKGRHTYWLDDATQPLPRSSSARNSN